MEIQRLISLPAGMARYFHQLEQTDPGEWYCGSDPPDRQLGSGGGTAALLAGAFKQEGSRDGMREWLSSRKRLVIHSGGESRRLPAYAPYGKSLLPMPVFRWSKGQSLDQKLLDFQSAFYERILARSTGSYVLLIGSGDVMMISSDRFRDLPEADVLVFGIWVEDPVASRHGVFFSSRETQDRLAFVRQKPPLDELRELSRHYFYLMDSGIVLMNASTAMTLMERSGWDTEKNAFPGDLPGYYDLYGDMLTCFGTEPVSKDEELNKLDVKLIPLHRGEFYHFGSNADLVESSLKLQNRITDQRLRFTRESDHHPSIFQQNSRIGYRFHESNHHIWIENSVIPGTWKLSHHHIITGIPGNSWNLEVPENVCIDLVPLKSGRYGIRTYGYRDGFRDSPEQGAGWMEVPLDDWLAKRGIDREQAGIDPGAAMQEQPLFPVAELEEVPDLLSGMWKPGNREGERWLRAERLSSKELAAKADAAGIYDQRRELRANALPRLAANHHRSVFYYLDLERTAREYRTNSLDLPPELPEDETVIKKIADNMFRARVIGNKAVSQRFEKKAFEILREEMIGTVRSEPVSPRRNVLDDQILWGRSPVRLDLAGGWTDTPPYCIMEGGKVVNLSVELNGQLPLQVFARPIEEPKIVLRSIDLGQKIEITGYRELQQFDTPGSGFSIPMAALVLAGFGPAFSEKHYPDLSSQLKSFGCGIEMSLLAAIPKGSGLGTSSNLAATVLGTLSDFCGLQWDKHDVSHRTLMLEQMLATGGGWQDQYGGIFGGIKLLETEPGIRQRPSIKWVSDHLFAERSTRQMMLLYYTGITRVARDILGEIVKGMFLNSSVHLGIFTEMKHHALETFNTLLENDYDGLAGKVALSWELNQRLDGSTNPPEIQEIIGKVEDLLLGCKLLGAGGGGYLLMCAKSADAAVRARQILETAPPNTRARFVDFSISESGFQVSRS